MNTFEQLKHYIMCIKFICTKLFCDVIKQKWDITYLSNGSVENRRITDGECVAAISEVRMS